MTKALEPMPRRTHPVSSTACDPCPYADYAGVNTMQQGVQRRHGPDPQASDAVRRDPRLAAFAIRCGAPEPGALYMYVSTDQRQRQTFGSTSVLSLRGAKVRPRASISGWWLFELWSKGHPGKPIAVPVAVSPISNGQKIDTRVSGVPRIFECQIVSYDRPASGEVREPFAEIGADSRA